VRDAVDRGEDLKNLVEPTSGNTGLGLVMVSNAHRFWFSAVMSNAVPLEKRSALR
jgi:cysteine synthase